MIQRWKGFSENFLTSEYQCLKGDHIIVIVPISSCKSTALRHVAWTISKGWNHNRLHSFLYQGKWTMNEREMPLLKEKKEKTRRALLTYKMWFCIGSKIFFFLEIKFLYLVMTWDRSSWKVIWKAFPPWTGKDRRSWYSIKLLCFQNLTILLLKPALSNLVFEQKGIKEKSIFSNGGGESISKN